ncbi:serine/threonine-protein kinase PITSLRE [Uranotaenia lowii]|uniref:serine/threonine-protein kinase PITSLRE n=1 Tax=Uranotaenia lowii TaxID=190385 RepID=UPI00247AEFF7|nr:serine/threonine-protein kinase PITSLRE [Uranotaenia lowii]
MSASDQSEDGQLISPDRFSGGEEETADSLDIKPPQSSAGRYYYSSSKRREKKSKHSRDHHRHHPSSSSGSGSRHYSTSTAETGSSSRRPAGDYAGSSSSGARAATSTSASGERSRDRENRYNKESQHRSGRGDRAGGQAQEKERYHGHHSSRDGRYEMNPFYGEMRETYQSKKEREREYYEKDRERRKDVEKDDPDKLLEDLRTRLLNKKNKYDSSKQQQQTTDEHASENRKEKHHYHHRHRERKEVTEVTETVEVVESPEFEEDNPSKKIVAEVKSKEHDERRAKLLEAEREMARRKEAARDELEIRRQIRKEQKKNSSVSSDSPVEKKSKLLLEEDDDEDMESVEGNKKKKKKKSKKRADSDHSDKDDATDDDEDETNSDTSSSTSGSEDSREGTDDDEKAPESPLSVGDLEKSDRDRRSPRSRSRSISRYRNRNRSRSQSRSTRSRSGSLSSRSRSRSPRRRHGSSRSDSPRSDRESDDNRKSNTREKDEPKSPVMQIEEEELPPYLPGIQGCRSVEEFQCLNRIEEGTYGVVYRAKDKRTEEIVALKRLKMEKEKEGFPITSLREINTLLKGQHPNIVTVREIVVGSNMDKIFIVMDYVEHDLKSLMETMKHKKQVFLPGEVKCLTQQLLRAVAHLHDNWILHRDLKTSNLLLSHKGILKVGDFGLAREYGSPLKAYTSIVVTLWYRAPELLLCCKEYSTPIDIWSVGCIFAEFLAMSALFPGKTELDQLNRIFKELGTPNEKIWPGYNQLPAVQKMTFTEYPVSNLRKRFAHQTSELGISLLQGLLTFDPKQRLTAEVALKHSYFKELPLPIDPAMFPTWPAKSELGLKKALASSPKPPSGGGEFKKLGDDAVAENAGFHLGGTYAESRQMAMGPGFSLKF